MPPLGINPGTSGSTAATGTAPKIDTSKLSGENQQLVQETLGLLQKDPFASKLLADAQKRNTPISFDNSGLKQGQAAGTQIKSDGTSKVVMGTSPIDKQKDKQGKMRAIAGMLGNELHSVTSVGEMAKSGQGIKSSGTKMQEGASFLTDGKFQGIVDKNLGGGTGGGQGSIPSQPKSQSDQKSTVSAKEGANYIEKEYGTSVGNVLNKAGSYASLPNGDISSAGFNQFVKLGIMDQAEADEANQEMTSILSGGGGAKGGTTPKAGKVSKIDSADLKEELSGNKPAPKPGQEKPQQADGKKFGDLELKD